MAQNSFRPVDFQRGNYRIEVVRRPGIDVVEVYLLLKGGVDVYAHHIEKGQIVAEKVKEGDEKVTPFLSVSGFLWGDLVTALTNDLPNISRDEIDAELKATKYHLEDMRKIVFKDLSPQDKSKENK